MKPPAEMHEGPEALTRFENTMRSLFSQRKSDVLPAKQDKPKKKRKRTS